MKRILLRQSVGFVSEDPEVYGLAKFINVFVGVPTVVPDWVVESEHFKILESEGKATVLDKNVKYVETVPNPATTTTVDHVTFPAQPVTQVTPIAPLQEGSVPATAPWVLQSDATSLPMTETVVEKK